MSFITPECVQPIPYDFLKKQVETGGLVPGYKGPELWDCTDDRFLAPFHAFRRQLEFGENSASFALAGAREGFALLDLVLRSSLEGEKSLTRYENFLKKTGTAAPFILHSVRFAQDTQYGFAMDQPKKRAALDIEYEFFRKLNDPNVSMDEVARHSEILLRLMNESDAAILNTHSDTGHEKHSRKIRTNPDQPDVGCAHNKLVGLVSRSAADERLLPSARKLGRLLGRGSLPFEQAQEGFGIVARKFNHPEPYSVAREDLVTEHAKHRKPADIVLDGSHLDPSETSMIIDGASTARNIATQGRHHIRTFLSNVGKAAERLGKISEFAEDEGLAEATIILHALAVRGKLCGGSPQDSPDILPIHVITPASLQRLPGAA